MANDASGPRSRFAKSQPSKELAVSVVLVLATVGLLVDRQPHAQSGLTAHWPLNDAVGVTAADASGNGHTGTLVGGPTWAPTGRVGGALDFDGVDDGVEVTNAPALGSPATLTLAAWINSRDPIGNTSQLVLGKYSNTSAGPYMLRLNGNRRLRFRAGGAVLTTGNVITAANAWYHVVATYDGSQLRVYVNGAEVASRSAGAPQADNGLKLTIGRYSDGGSPFNGLLDDIRLYSRALSAAEILSLFDTTAPTVPTGLTATPVSPTQVNLAWNAATDNVGVTGYDVYRGGVQIAAVTTASYANSGLSPATAYSFTIAARDAAGNVSAFSASAGATTPSVDVIPPSVVITGPPAGPVSGTVNVTASASDNIGVLSVQFRLDGQALGAEDLAVPYERSWNTSTASNGPHVLTAVARDAAGNMTVSAPVSVTVFVADTTAPTITNVNASNITLTNALINWTTNEPADSQVRYGTTTAYGSLTTLDPSRITTHAHMLAGLQPATLYHYQVLSRDAAGNLATSPDFSLTMQSLNAGFTAHWPLNDLNGSTAADVSGNGHAGTLVGGPTWTPTGRVGGALDFDGVDDGVEVTNAPALASPTALTLAAWINSRDPSATASQMVLGKYSGAVGGPYMLRLNGANRVRFRAGNTQMTTSAVIPAANTWYHLAATYDGSELRVYVNGVSVASLPAGAPQADNGLKLTIGRFSDGGSPFNGLLDDVRLYSRALSAGEVLDIFNQAPGQASLRGQWSSSVSWPLVAVHMMMLPDGRVLAFDGPPHHGGVTAQVWDPIAGTFTPVMVGSNVFCSGHTLLSDGRVLVSGGHLDYYVGLDELNIFDPSNLSWASPIPRMQYPRWYPTTTTLPDGRVLIVSGAMTCQSCQAPHPEVFSPQTGTMTTLMNAPFVMDNYPFMFVLPNGDVLAAGALETRIGTPTRTLNVSTQTWTTIDPAHLVATSAVMYEPGKVMKSGANTYVLDMTQPSPAWVQTAPAQFPRTFHNLTLLPDGTTLAVGGINSLVPVVPAVPILTAELWSPVTKTWTALAAMTNMRQYHSTAILLPDGRVVVAGGGRDGGENPDFLSAEYFSPPYLFKGPRPTIATAPAAGAYGATFTVSTPDASNIARVTLVRLPSVTHGFDENQRFVELSFQQQAGSLTVTAPANANLAPPGDYMLFILNGNGVPSAASIIRF